MSQIWQACRWKEYCKYGIAVHHERKRWETCLLCFFPVQSAGRIRLMTFCRQDTKFFDLPPVQREYEHVVEAGDESISFTPRSSYKREEIA